MPACGKDDHASRRVIARDCGRAAAALRLVGRGPEITDPSPVVESAVRSPVVTNRAFQLVAVFAAALAFTNACASREPTKTATHAVAPRPTTSAAPSATAPATSPASIETGLIVDVSPAGEVLVDGAKVETSALGGVRAAKSDDEITVIRAKADVRWGRVIEVLVALKGHFKTGAPFVLALRDDAAHRTAPIRLGSRSPTQDRATRSGGRHDEPEGEVTVTVLVDIDRDGNTSVDGRPMDSAFRERLRERVVADGARVVVVGPPDAPFGAIVDAAMKAQSAGAAIALGVGSTSP